MTNKNKDNTTNKMRKSLKDECMIFTKLDKIKQIFLYSEI